MTMKTDAWLRSDHAAEVAARLCEKRREAGLPAYIPDDWWDAAADLAAAGWNLGDPALPAQVVEAIWFGWNATV